MGKMPRWIRCSVDYEVRDRSFAALWAVINQDQPPLNGAAVPVIGDRAIAGTVVPDAKRLVPRRKV